MSAKFKLFLAVGFLMLLCIGLSGCGAKFNIIEHNGTTKMERTTASYFNEGKYWGEKLREANVTPGKLHLHLIDTLIGQNLDYFNVHEELKDAFKKGFRIGYEDRIADLVLGPHIKNAAGRIGKRTGTDFVTVTENFEDGWKQTFNDAVRVFIVLIAEGSQADREYFISQFDEVYAAKYHKTEKIKADGGFRKLLSQGGTILFLNVKTTSAALDIPSPTSLEGEIYKQAFTAMGDEWGKRLSNNLIKRSDLIELLRRTKAALKEKGDFNENLGIVRNSFENSYGTDAGEIFAGLIREAGYEHYQAAHSNSSQLKKARR